MGVTLSQCDEQGYEYPILYFSKKLTEREQAYEASKLVCSTLIGYNFTKIEFQCRL